MNKVQLIGRLTKDVETRTTSGGLTVGRYTLAVDRKYKKDEEQTADFINCVVFGKSADFATNYFHKGLKIAVVGRIQTGSYTKDDGTKVYTTDVIVEEQEFTESKKAADAQTETQATPAFDDITPIDDGDMPF